MHPSSEYGYIISDYDGSISFIEKPNKDIAQRLIQERQCSWNSGLFATKVKTILDLLSPLSSWILEPREGKGPSFDIQVLQRFPNIIVQRTFNWGWTDVGSISTIFPLISIDNQNIHHAQCEDEINIINLAKDKKVVCIGLPSSIHVVNTDEGVLIMSKDPSNNSHLKMIAGSF